MKDKILKAIIVILIIIIILILLLIKLLRGQETDDNFESQEDTSFDIIYDQTIDEQLSNVEFRNVRDCVQLYIDYIEDKNEDAIYKVLDTNFVKENNITLNNILNSIEKYKGNIFLPKDMKKKEINTDIIVYYVQGEVLDNNYKNGKDIKVAVIIDNKQNVFSIIPKDIEEDNNYKYNLDIKYDNEDYYNELIYKNYTIEDITIEYFNYYKDLAINNSEKAFNILDAEYREKRFKNNIVNFDKYLKDIDIENIFCKKFQANVYEDYTEYVCVDKNGLYYIFKEYKPMEISLQLDTYTIVPEKFIKTYSQSKEQKRVQMNVDKFIQMVNSKDYIASYNCISEGFKNNYFNTQEKFEIYIKEHFFSYNNFKFRSIEKKGSDIYVCSVQLTDLTEESSELKDIDIIMKLNDDIDFEMSFGM